MTRRERDGTRAVLTVPEAAQVLGIGRNLAYSGVQKGWLPALRCGRRLVVPQQALEMLLLDPASAQNPWKPTGDSHPTPTMHSLAANDAA